MALWTAVEGVRGILSMPAWRNSGRCGGRRGSEVLWMCSHAVDVGWFSTSTAAKQHECCTCVDLRVHLGRGAYSDAASSFVIAGRSVGRL